MPEAPTVPPVEAPPAAPKPETPPQQTPEGPSASQQEAEDLQRQVDTHPDDPESVLEDLAEDEKHDLTSQYDRLDDMQDLSVDELQRLAAEGNTLAKRELGYKAKDAADAQKTATETTAPIPNTEVPPPDNEATTNIPETNTDSTTNIPDAEPATVSVPDVDATTDVPDPEQTTNVPDTEAQSLRIKDRLKELGLDTTVVGGEGEKIVKALENNPDLLQQLDKLTEALSGENAKAFAQELGIPLEQMNADIINGVIARETAELQAAENAASENDSEEAKAVVKKKRLWLQILKGIGIALAGFGAVAAVTAVAPVAIAGKMKS